MLTYRAVDLQTLNIHMDLVKGYTEPAEVRGEDDVMPGAAGREPGIRRADVRHLIIEGHVRGTGATPAARALSWRIATDALAAILDRTLAPGDLEVGPAAPAQFPSAAAYLGLTVDRVLTGVRVENFMAGPVQSHMSYQAWSIELVSIASPPNWANA
jgi:hypothetical protein